MPEQPSHSLVAILRLAYSGELAAGYAYRGHWHSVSHPDERIRIRTIEDEEWRHRKLVGEMLGKLNARPSLAREIRATIIGRILGMLCHFTGWLAPMYGAGKLESRNITKYETAALYARACGYEDFIDCLLKMAEVEWEHEQYFRLRVLSHPMARWLRLWPQPAPKAAIRRSFNDKNKNVSNLSLATESGSGPL